MAQQILMTLPEVVDRLTICELKLKHLKLADAPEGKILAQQQQVAYFAQGVDTADPTVREELKELRRINGLLWDAESAIREAQDQGLPLEEIGRRTLRIHALNNERVAAKNRIAAALAPAFLDYRVNYAKPDQELRQPATAAAERSA